MIYLVRPVPGYDGVNDDFALLKDELGRGQLQAPQPPAVDVHDLVANQQPTITKNKRDEAIYNITNPLLNILILTNWSHEAQIYIYWLFVVGLDNSGSFLLIFFF